MITEARRRATEADVWAQFEIGDAQSLRFDDGTFDACRTERMLMHVPDAAGAFSELVRVTRPGGRVVVFDFDWETAVVDSPQRPTTRLIMRSFADGIRHGWIGRQLPRLFREHGLIDVTVTPHTVMFPYEFAELLWGGHLTRAEETGIVSASELAQWWAGLKEAHDQHRFFAGLTAFIVAGTTT
jgi:ubiquinone/menaquinone biosynthesis C-methylase UbiE